jgi:hypothetical protein
MKTLIFISLFLLMLSCIKENLESIHDIEARIDLLDENKNSTRVFNYGEDLIFRYTETNKTSDTIYYYGTHCPVFHFNVYDESDNLLGDAIPDNWGCTAVLLLLNIGPKESKISEINWFNDSTNVPIPVGNYKLKFENIIEIPEINHSEKYNLMIEFRIKQ